MILYLDTSALVKLYIQEEHDDLVKKLVGEANSCGSSMIAYVEIKAAFARALREHRVSAGVWHALKSEFEKTWEHFFQVSVSQKILESAAALAEKFALRSYDSVHLASAEYVKQNAQDSFVFACFDKQLNVIAKKIGIKCI